MRQDVTSLGNDFALSSPPTEIWVITSLEFPVIYAGRKYLLCTQPYYGVLSSPNNFGEGILYPPFFSRKIDHGYIKPQRLGQVREAMATVDPYMRSPVEWAAFAYNLGLGEPEFEYLGHIDELKSSPREHGPTKFFRVIRVRAWNPAPLGKRNISDPEFIKGHFFVPLDLSPFDGPKVEALGPHKYRFASKAMASHFDVLQQFYNNEASSERYTTIAADEVVNLESGVIAFFDVSGFGFLELSSDTHNADPLSEGSLVSERFRVALASRFEQFFTEVGSSQSRIMGDGFVCGIPFRFYGHDKEALIQSVLFAWKRMIGDLEAMNNRTAADIRKVGSRFVLTTGDYKYGRVGGLAGFNADFDGRNVIVAARISSDLSLKSGPSAHVIGVDAATAELAESTMNTMGISTKPVTSTQKERELAYQMAQLAI